jgi:hypothetical protein
MFYSSTAASLLPRVFSVFGRSNDDEIPETADLQAAGRGMYSLSVPQAGWPLSKWLCFAIRVASGNSREVLRINELSHFATGTKLDEREAGSQGHVILSSFANDSSHQLEPYRTYTVQVLQGSLAHSYLHSTCSSFELIFCTTASS